MQWFVPALVLTLILPPQNFAFAGPGGGGGGGGGGGSRSSGGSSTSRAGTSGVRGGGGSTVKFGASGFRPSPVRTIPRPGASSSVSHDEYWAATMILNPGNPMSPLSPLNPINQMNLRDDDDNTIFEKVLRVDHEGGVIRAYQCLLHRDEKDKPEPMEQNCVLLSEIRETQIQRLIDKTQSCSELSFLEGSLLVTLALLGGSVGTVVAMVPEFFNWDISGRALVGAGLTAAIISGLLIYYYGFKGPCEDGVALVAKRLSDELTDRVPVGSTRLIPVDERVWSIFDAALAR